VVASARANRGSGLSSSTRLGRYEVLDLLATGGMGEVYLARALGPEQFEKLVALKRILPHLHDDEDFVEMFLQEARLAATLDHPNLVQVIELGRSDYGWFMTMEFVHGRDLQSLIRAVTKADGRVPLGCTLTIGVALASGLHYAHERQGHDGRPLGLVHRDVSPSNVIVSYDGVVKLVDFGVAKAAARTARTRATALKGKIGYMSPEQCRGLPVDRRSDVFSLGVLLYELTTLQRPFHDDNHFAALNRIVAGKFERPSEIIADYPAGLEQIVLRAMTPDPTQRYPSARAMLTDLEQFASAEGVLLSSTTLSDWVIETCGRPPYPTWTPATPEPVVPPTIPAAPPRRGPSTQMWLVGGLLVTTAMSSLALVLALSREPSAATSGTNEIEAPAVEATTPEPAKPEPATPEPATPVPAKPVPAKPEAAPVVETPAEASAPSPPPTRKPAVGESRKKKPRRAAETSEPEKPSFDSIFPPK
jgi:serine/threonine protein kinase